MLDERGFVAELNGSNLFMVKENHLYTPFAHACLPGITRETVIALCNDNNISIEETDITLSQLYNADGVFATGTMGELTPVVEIDGRTISRESQLMETVCSLFKSGIRNFLRTSLIQHYEDCF